MKKPLIAYFSASGTTAKVAKALATEMNADLYEIRPAVPYTQADLNWQNSRSRSSLESKDLTARPRLLDLNADVAGHDQIFVGFPIWWYTAPRIIRTFLESYDFSGKTVILFATSGGSGLGRTAMELAPSCPGATIKDGRVFHGGVSENTLKKWIEKL